MKKNVSKFLHKNNNELKLLENLRLSEMHLMKSIMSGKNAATFFLELSDETKRSVLFNLHKLHEMHEN